MWPTPAVPNGGRSLPAEIVLNAGRGPDGRKHQVNLHNLVEIWPTPTTADHVGSRRITAMTPEWKSNPGTTLTDAVWLFEGEAGTGFSPQDPSSWMSGPKSSGSTPKLNPEFVNWLMGFPTGWNDCSCPVTPSSQWWRLWRSYLFGAT